MRAFAGEWADESMVQLMLLHSCLGATTWSSSTESRIAPRGKLWLHL
jgi:hypothetical protein